MFLLVLRVCTDMMLFHTDALGSRRSSIALAHEHIDLDLEITLRIAADHGWPAVIRGERANLRRHLADAIRGSRVTRSHRMLLRALVHQDAPVALRIQARSVLPRPDLPGLLGLPPGYAGDLVSACAALEPRWIEYMLRELVTSRPDSNMLHDNGVAVQILRFGVDWLDFTKMTSREIKRLAGRGRKTNAAYMEIVAIDAAYREGNQQRCRRQLLELLKRNPATVVMGATPRCGSASATRGGDCPNGVRPMARRHARSRSSTRSAARRCHAGCRQTWAWNSA